MHELDICYGGALRIRSTPLPYAYFVHLRSIIFIYVLILPFALVSFASGISSEDEGLSAASQLVACFASAYAILGVEQTAIELEHPYGETASGLPMEAYCNSVWLSLAELLSFHESLHANGWDLARAGVTRGARGASSRGGTYTPPSPSRSGAQHREGAARSSR